MYCGYQGTGTYDTTRSATDTSWTITGCGYSRIGSFFVMAVVRDCWRPLSLSVPKNWRWFHVFFAWAEPIIPNVRAVYGAARRFVQDRFSLKEKARRKRRAFVQALHAA